MDKYRRISELMKGFQRSGQVFFPATVESVEGNTCTVEVDDLSISDVRLKATNDETDDIILITPAVGSNVLVGSYSGDYNNLFIIHSDSVSEVYCKVGETAFKLDKNGIEINDSDGGSEINCKVGETSFKLHKNGIVINDGKNEGVVNINTMVEWMKKVYDDLQSLKTQLQTHPVVGNGSPLALVFTPKTEEPKTTYFEDSKLKH